MIESLNYDPDQYKVGDRDDRPWGSWEVTKIHEEDGEQVVEKIIKIHPTGILSLQSHKHRREIWTVISGTIRMILNDDTYDLAKGKSVTIQAGDKHRMANPFLEEAIVHEKQIGECRESDFFRYEDQYGRA